MIIKPIHTVNTEVLKRAAKESNIPKKTFPCSGPSRGDILSISFHVLSQKKWRCTCPTQSGSLQFNLQNVVIFQSLTVSMLSA